MERFFRQLGGVQFSGFCSFKEVTIEEEFENKSANTNWPLGHVGVYFAKWVTTCFGVYVPIALQF